MDFNIFDAIVISITLILAIKGYFSGVVKEISGLVGIALGVYLGSLYYKQAGVYIDESIFKIPNESAINVVGFISVFISIWAIVIFLGIIFSKMLKIAQLGFLDRLGGIVFGAGKFFLIVSIIINLLSQIETIQENLSKYQNNSVMWPIMKKIGDNLIHMKPEEIKKKIENVKNEINNNISKNISDNIKPKIEETIKKVVEKQKGE